MRSLRLVLPDVWRTRGAAARLLLPLSWLYRAIVWARRACYRRGLCRVAGFSRPVIVVGSISVGGSGKTPLVMHVARLLSNNGHKPGIVSRGYGARPPRRPLRVTAQTPPAESGDEPAMMAHLLNVPVVVDRNRPRGVRALINDYGCDVVVADDGLQHYAMGRDVEIAVVSGVDGWGNGYCLPAGPLREPAGRLRDVDLVVCNGPGAAAGQFAMSLEIAELAQLHGDRTRRIDDFRGRRVHAVAGIGNPGAFFRMLEAAGLDVERHAFADHHRFEQQDFTAMTDAPIVMTAKDAVKCTHLTLEDAWVANALATLSQDFDNKLLEYLNHDR